ncbi:MAG: Bifunctional hemolysin/adenylate cyclase precursor, partial [Planctomycetota bacterium]
MHHPRRPIRPCSALLAVCGLLSGGQTALAAAAAGDRDAGFGNGGVAVADLADTAFGRNSSALYLVRVQADGRIVGLGTGAGGGFVARWNANGTVDPTFGIGGLSVLPGRFLLSTAVVKPIALTLLADGRILVGGSVSAGDPQVDSGSYAAVWRLGANGLPDLAWNGGRPFLDMSPSDTGGYTNAILGVHPQGDGSVLATAQLTGSMAVLKLTPGGQPDTAFAPAGRKTLTVPNTSSLQLFRSVAQPDGRILVTGAISRPPNGNDGDGAIVARLTTAGTFDTGFDGDGYTVFKFGTPPDAADQLSRWWGQDIALQSDGAILVSGSSYYGGSDKKQQSGVVRLTPAGAIDTAFGTLFSGVSHGFIFNGKNANPDMAEGIAVQGDDRIITGGWNFPSSYVARHTADGRTRQFEVAPPTTAQGGWPGYWIHAIALQGDGGVIAAGEGVTAGNDNRSLLLRITAAGARDTTFGGGAPGLAPQPAARAQEIVSELLLADGKPVVAAAVTLDDSSGNGLTLSGLARFTGEGALDPSFSGDGRLVLRLGSAATTNAITEVPADVARDAQGRLLVVGPALASNPNTGTTEPTLISLARFLADGTPDSGFATGGRIQFPAKGPFGVMAAVAVQADGKPVLITGSNGSTGTEILLRRL